MSTRWSPDFLDLVTALNDADVKYLLVGGHAVGLFGRPRATKDFDLWIEASPENATRLLRALVEFGAPIGQLTATDFAKPGSGFRMGEPPFRIELLTEISGVAFDEAWPRKEVHDLDGVRCYVISRGDLLANKKAAGRPQDLADVDLLEKQARRRKS